MPKKEDWVVAFSFFLVYFMFAGMQKSSGVFFIEIIHLFNINRPLVGYLGIRYEPTAVVLFGCFLATLGIGFNFVTPNIATFTVFWAVFGAGHGLSVLLVPQILNNNFEKYFSTACGIALGGASVGGIVLPILSKALIETYTVSGALLIISGLSMHLVPLMYILHCNAIRNKRSLLHRNQNVHSIVTISGHQVNDCLKLQPCSEVKTDEVLNPHVNMKYRWKSILQGNSFSEPICHQENPKSAKLSFWLTFLVFFDATFLAMILVIGLIFGIMSFLNTMMVDMYMEKNIHVTEAIYIVSAISCADIVGRVFAGRISDSGRITSVNLTILCEIIMMFCYLSLVWCKGFIVCVVPSIFLGLVIG